MGLVYGLKNSRSLSQTSISQFHDFHQCISHGKYMLSKKRSIKKVHHEQMILLIFD